MYRPVPVAFLSLCGQPDIVQGTKTGKTKHISHKTFLTVIDARDGKDILLAVTDTPQKTVRIPLQAVQDKTVTGNMEAFAAKYGDIPGLNPQTVSKLPLGKHVSCRKTVCQTFPACKRPGFGCFGLDSICLRDRCPG